MQPDFDHIRTAAATGLTGSPCPQLQSTILSVLHIKIDATFRPGISAAQLQLKRVMAAKVSPSWNWTLSSKCILDFIPSSPGVKIRSDHYMKFSTVLFVFHLTLCCVKDTNPTLLGQFHGEPCPVAEGHRWHSTLTRVHHPGAPLATAKTGIWMLKNIPAYPLSVHRPVILQSFYIFSASVHIVSSSMTSRSPLCTIEAYLSV